MVRKRQKPHCTRPLSCLLSLAIHRSTDWQLVMSTSTGSLHRSFSAAKSEALPFDIVLGYSMMGSSQPHLFFLQVLNETG